MPIRAATWAIPVRDRTGCLRSRASTYIHGAGADAEALAAHLHSFLGSLRS